MNVTVSKTAAVTTISLSRPDCRNAVDRPTAAELAQAFADFEQDSSQHVAVLTGENGHFCAGADLKAVASNEPERVNRVLANGDGPMGPTRMQLSKPVIAAIEGYAVAGGLELAIWCDLRVAAENATFGVFCRRWGVPLIDGGTFRLARLIGQSRAMDMILTGRPVPAEEAERIGLANRLVPAGQAKAAAEALAAEIAAFPQLCLRSDRMSLLEQWGLDESAAISNEYQHGLVPLQNKESLRGAGRFSAGAGRHGDFSQNKSAIAKPLD